MKFGQFVSKAEINVYACAHMDAAGYLRHRQFSFLVRKYAKKDKLLVKEWLHELHTIQTSEEKAYQSKGFP